MTIKINIPGDPIAQARPRAVKMGKGIRMYDPKPSADYKKYVATIAKQHAPNKPIESALGVKLKIYRQIPKSTTKKRRQAMNDGIERPIVKADIDNYSKAILDSLNGIIYKDDSQVVGLWAEKYYSDSPCAIIEITEVF
ncbi:hypothetical protein GCM10007063_05810 [Lentibacillus kapialis]|uniref:Uncharacterized protein n=1 Tax=Lentibacillus kapialis TaxID=340214 RepID=A0A917PPD7_9BACI|nr:RusA family crossover junction endodeoxyribonuclease [Lentibacillus kapialis]GGJ86148.1 hypothetical protein GCM10007063_05810 [Lentibacillus kapialis]